MKKKFLKFISIGLMSSLVICSSCETIKNCFNPKSKIITSSETCSKCGKTSCDKNCSSNLSSNSASTNKKILDGCTNHFSKEEQKMADKLLQSGFIKKIKSISETELGYSLTYEEPTEFASQLLEIIQLEKKCASEYTLTLVFVPNSNMIQYQYTASTKEKKEELKTNFIKLGLTNLLNNVN